jgi:hypothetical protein
MNSWILAGAAVAVAAALIYQAREITGLDDHIAQLEADSANLQSALRTAEDDLDALRGGQTALEAELNAFGSVEAVSDAVMAKHGLALTAELADRLTSDPAYAEALRGPEGPKPETNEIIARLVEMDLPAIVADHIWKEHHVELTQMPQLIATVAAVVYETYGADLRPADGAAPSPEEVASALALNPAFMALVKEQSP